MNKERLNYLDLAKGFGIFAITLGHIYSNNFIRTWLCSFHLSLFFIISGILIRHTNIDERSFKDAVIVRFKRLIIPYFYFEVLAILIWMLLNNKINLITFKWSIMDTILIYTKAGATWFLPCLFVSELVFIFLIKVIKNNKLRILIFMTIFIIPFFIESKNHFIIVFFRNFTAIGFLAFGYYSYNFIMEKDIDARYVIFTILMTIGLSILNGVVDLYSLKYNNPVIYTICSIFGSYLVILTFKKIKHKKINKIFNYYGTNSLIVMATQQVILSYFISRITGINAFNYNYLYGIVILIVIMIIEIPIIYIINNYLPFMLGNFLKRKV